MNKKAFLQTKFAVKKLIQLYSSVIFRGEFYFNKILI